MSDLNYGTSPFSSHPDNPWASEGADRQTPLTPTEPTADDSGRGSRRRTAMVAVVTLAVGVGVGWFSGARGSEDTADGVQMYSGDGIYGFPGDEISNIPDALARGLFDCDEMTVNSDSEPADGVICYVGVDGYRGLLRYVGSTERC